jgi:hypothetical protein
MNLIPTMAKQDTGFSKIDHDDHGHVMAFGG